MTEMEDRELDPWYLKEQIDNLQWLLSIVISTMTREQRGYIESRMVERSRQAQDEARRRDTDPARDRAAIFYDLEESIRNRTDEAASEMAPARNR